MPTNILVWALILVMIIIGLVVCTILAERLMHQRKQAKYDELHRRMGLNARDHDPPLGR